MRLCRPGCGFYTLRVRASAAAANRSTPSGAWRALEELCEEGKLRAIGISNFYADRMVDFAVFRRIKPMVNQVETHIFNQQKTLKTWADKYGIQLEAWRPLGKTARKPLTILLFCRLERNTEKQRRR